MFCLYFSLHFLSLYIHIYLFSVNCLWFFWGLSSLVRLDSLFWCVHVFRCSLFLVCSFFASFLCMCTAFSPLTVVTKSRKSFLIHINIILHVCETKITPSISLYLSDVYRISNSIIFLFSALSLICAYSISIVVEWKPKNGNVPEKEERNKNHKEHTHKSCLKTTLWKQIYMSISYLWSEQIVIWIFSHLSLSFLVVSFLLFVPFFLHCTSKNKVHKQGTSITTHQIPWTTTPFSNYY